jgi:hypothetical protein
MKRAEQLLKVPTCGEGLFKGTALALAALHGASYRFATLTPASVGATVIDNRVTINMEGPFVNVPTTLHASRHTTFRGLLLLHEVGHIRKVLESDAGNFAQSEANNRIVAAHCSPYR